MACHNVTTVELLASRLARVELMVGRAEQVANSMQVSRGAQVANAVLTCVLEPVGQAGRVCYCASVLFRQQTLRRLQALLLCLAGSNDGAGQFKRLHQCRDVPAARPQNWSSICTAAPSARAHTHTHTHIHTHFVLPVRPTTTRIASAPSPTSTRLPGSSGASPKPSLLHGWARMQQWCRGCGSWLSVSTPTEDGGLMLEG
eukprot:scaffold199898_cov22-Tisochrysis_lutea.AAC.1